MPAAPRLTRNIVEGEIVEDYIRLEHNDHSSRMQMQFLGIIDTEEELVSQYAGYIGLAPPKSQEEHMRSFLYNAHKDGLIDKYMFALYTSIRSDVPSSLKFGGYDVSGIKPGEQLTWMHTKENDSWALAARFMIVFDETVQMEADQPRVILIEPQMPYMYLPEFEFASFAQNAMDVYPDLKCKRTYCYFES